MNASQTLKVVWLLGGMLLATPAGVQAQFTFTTNNGAITITGYNGSDSELTIPDIINGWPVTSIRNSAFFNHHAVTSVTIPNSVITIGQLAFYGCSSLTNVTIGNNVISIGTNAFSGNGLINVVIPNSVTSIAYEAFAACTNLISMTIGNGITNIGSYAFNASYRLQEVYCAGNAPDLGQYPFSSDGEATIYYLPGTTGWGTTFGGRPTVQWFLPNPLILNYGPGFGVQTNGFGFTISWATNISVVVETCTNFAEPVWSPVATNTLVNGAFYFSDAQWTNYSGRFYRLRSP